MKKTLAFILFFAFIFSALCYGADINESNYYSMLTQLKNNDLKADFSALRMSYTKTADYQPYGGDTSKTINAAYESLGKKEFKEASKLAETVLEKNFVDLDAHFICQIAFRELGSLTKYGFHRNILKGLVNSLYASGNGLKPETAIVVITTREEYFLMNANGLKRTKQSLINANGHRYDKMEVENKKTGEKKVLYFNVDIPFVWLSKNLKKK
jgi:hypothetical protein